MKTYKYNELFIGLKDSFEVKINLDLLDKFAGISGDVNPLHMSDEYAKSKNMSGRVAHGMLTSSFYSTLVGVYLPGEKCLLHSIDISFKKPAFANDILVVTGEIIYLNDVYKVAEINANIKNQKGEKISVAKINIGVLE
ncbi:MAG: MaoC/PaaZ C-terminal domain-containing protein [Fusobacteriaceae bacterium]